MHAAWYSKRFPIVLWQLIGQAAKGQCLPHLAKETESVVDEDRCDLAPVFRTID